MTCKEALFPTTGTDKKAMDERCPLLVLASVSNMICGTLTVILGLIQVLELDKRIIIMYVQFAPSRSNGT